MHNQGLSFLGGLQLRPPDLDQQVLGGAWALATSLGTDGQREQHSGVGALAQRDPVILQSWRLKKGLAGNDKHWGQDDLQSQ